jgi:hypothetical protein
MAGEPCISDSGDKGFLCHPEGLRIIKRGADFILSLLCGRFFGMLAKEVAEISAFGKNGPFKPMILYLLLRRDMRKYKTGVGG